MKRLLFAGVMGVAFAIPAYAGPVYTFSVSEGVNPTDVGKITLTQIDATHVDVSVALKDYVNPAPRYGFINTGGPHTPFAFNLAGTETGVSAVFIAPPAGVFSFGVLSLSTGDGDAQPFGTFGVSINDSAGNGSGKGYYGPLQFDVFRPSGLSTDDFIANLSGAFFAADLTDGDRNTGSQAWKTRTGGGTPDPQIVTAEPGMVGVFALGIGALAFLRRRA